MHKETASASEGASVKRRVVMSYPTAILILVLIIALSFVLGTRAYKLPLVGGANSSDFSSLSELYGTLSRMYDGSVDKAKLIDGAKHGMVDALGDPHTMYLNAEEAAAFDGDLNGHFEGIGAELGKVDGVLTIMGVINDSPAQKNGIKTGDMILRVNDDDTAGLTVGQAVQKIRGAKGTSVRLTLVRDGQSHESTLVRDTISTPSVISEVLEQGKVGYLRVSRFGDDTPAVARAEATKLKEQGVSSVVLDLRGNGGGYVSAAQEIAGLWFRDTVVATERRGGEIQRTFRTGRADTPLAGLKTVVLIDGGSASASEIVALALSEHGAAQTMGTKTYGKGTMQVPETLPSGGMLKVTVARWFSDKGVNVDKKGITPGTVVELSETDQTGVTDSQKAAAVQAAL